MLAAHAVYDGQADDGHGPAHGIGQHESKEVAVRGKCRIEPEDTDTADTNENDDSWRQGIAVAPQGPGDDVNDAIEVKRAGNTEQPQRPELHDDGITVEQGNQRFGKKEYRRHHYQEKPSFYGEGHLGDAETAAQIPCPIILPDKGRCRLTECNVIRHMLQR